MNSAVQLRENKQQRLYPTWRLCHASFSLHTSSQTPCSLWENKTLRAVDFERAQTCWPVLVILWKDSKELAAVVGLRLSNDEEYCLECGRAYQPEDGFFVACDKQISAF